MFGIVNNKTCTPALVPCVHTDPSFYPQSLMHSSFRAWGTSSAGHVADPKPLPGNWWPLLAGGQRPSRLVHWQALADLQSGRFGQAPFLPRPLPLSYPSTLSQSPKCLTERQTARDTTCTEPWSREPPMDHGTVQSQKARLRSTSRSYPISFDCLAFIT